MAMYPNKDDCLSMCPSHCAKTPGGGTAYDCLAKVAEEPENPATTAE